MEMAFAKQEIMELCRVCEDTQNLIDLSTVEFSHLNDKLHQISDFEDTYSCLLQYICVACSMKLESAFDFKTQCEFTYRKLIDQMENNTFLESYDTDSYAEAGKRHPNLEDIDDDLEVENEQIYFEVLEVVKNSPETINLDSDSDDNSDSGQLTARQTTEGMPSTKDMEILPIECDVSAESGEEFMADHDDSSKPFPCPTCGKAFKGMGYLKRHLARGQCHRTHFECNICGTKYPSFGTLNRHKMIHSAETFPCEICGKIFNTITYMKLHRKKHMVSFKSNGKSLSCQICGHLSEDAVQHTKHIKIHNTAERPHKCEACGKSFLRKQYLIEHKRMHTGERPFPCHICSYAFRYRTHLSRHLKTHNGTKAYKCKECGKSYMQSTALTSHIRIHHGPKRWK